MTEPEQLDAAPPVYEVQLTRLVTFIVDVEELRKDQDEGDDWNPEEAASDFVEGLQGADVDNYATIDYVYPPVGSETLASLDYAITLVDLEGLGKSAAERAKIDFYLRRLRELRVLVAGGEQPSS